jgi:hypothetical protein
MTRFSFANLGKWAEKEKRIRDAVVKQATNDMIVGASRTATGVSRGGVVKQGFVPRMDGTLAASLISTLHGSTAITQGEGDFSMVVGSMRAGDRAVFTWTAPHAKAKNWGRRGQQGWHWVEEAVNNWPVTFNAAAARARVTTG